MNVDMDIEQAAADFFRHAEMEGCAPHDAEAAHALRAALRDYVTELVHELTDPKALYSRDQYGKTLNSPARAKWEAACDKHLAEEAIPDTLLARTIYNNALLAGKRPGEAIAAIKMMTALGRRVA